MFNVHDREEELKFAAPMEVRRASHDLSNVTMMAEGAMREVRKKADALTLLLEQMRHDEGERT